MANHTTEEPQAFGLILLLPGLLPGRLLWCEGTAVWALGLVLLLCMMDGHGAIGPRAVIPLTSNGGLIPYTLCEDIEPVGHGGHG